MKKILILACSMLVARDNPFEPFDTTLSSTDHRAIPPQQLQRDEITLPPSSRIIKSISITHQEVDGTISKVDKRVDKRIDWHSPIEIKQSDNATKLPRAKHTLLPVEELEDLKEINFFVQGDTLKLETKSELLRDFFLPKPNRIILDFASTTPLESRSAVIEGGFFTNILVTFHGEFYRVEVTLDSFYPYKVVPTKDGFLLGLN